MKNYTNKLNILKIAIVMIKILLIIVVMIIIAILILSHNRIHMFISSCNWGDRPTLIK